VARAQPAPAGVDPIIDEFGYIRRNERFRSLPGLTRMQGTRVAIYGVGAVGRQVALGLATMGFKNLVLIDPDIVDTPNLGTQGYKERDYGKEKVKATAQGCKDRCRACKVVSAHKMVGKESRVGKEWLYSRPKESREEIAFLCVDDMITRQEIGELEELQPAHLLVDTRMGAYAARIIADVHPFERWKKTLFSDSAAFTGRCTLQSTYFMAAVCAGAAIATLWRYASAGIGHV
jgi:sulfur carrier protein ThiS adenylyltransferase